MNGGSLDGLGARVHWKLKLRTEVGGEVEDRNTRLLQLQATGTGNIRQQMQEMYRKCVANENEKYINLQHSTWLLQCLWLD